jgi:serine/threonine protein kinase
MQQLVEGVAYIHSKGWVHGDIKGDNILVKFGRTASSDRIKVRVHAWVDCREGVYNVHLSYRYIWSLSVGLLSSAL